jgi:hypothetical protein
MKKMTAQLSQVIQFGTGDVSAAEPVAVFPASVSLRITSITGGKDLSEEIFDFLLVRLKPFSSIL